MSSTWDKIEWEINFTCQHVNQSNTSSWKMHKDFSLEVWVLKFFFWYLSNMGMHMIRFITLILWGLLMYSRWDSKISVWCLLRLSTCVRSLYGMWYLVFAHSFISHWILLILFVWLVQYEIAFFVECFILHTICKLRYWILCYSGPYCTCFLLMKVSLSLHFSACSIYQK